MTIKIVREKITRSELKTLAQETFQDMIKVAVDIERDVLAAGGELHKDIEAALLADGSAARNVWGVCIYFTNAADETIEYRSHINIKPSEGNSSTSINSDKLRETIRETFWRHVDWSA